LVDAGGLNPRGGNTVWVRIPSWAQSFNWQNWNRVLRASLEESESQ